MFAVKIFSAALASPSLMHEPMYYSIVWLFFGILFLGLILLIIFFILYTTRKKPIKSLSNLKPAKPQIKDIAAIRQKYLQMVDEVEQRFGTRKIRAARAHQELSLVVRLFYTEVSGFHAEVLTLSDIKRSKNIKLANLIDKYYPDEFDCLEHGSVLDSARKARELIMDSEAVAKLSSVNNPNISLPNQGDKQ